jgi:hypothetical protein
MASMTVNSLDCVENSQRKVMWTSFIRKHPASESWHLWNSDNILHVMGAKKMLP